MMSACIIFSNTTNPEKYEISTICYEPDKMLEEIKSKGVIVDEIPVPNTPEGKKSVLYYNSVLKTLFYEYVDRVLSPEEQKEQRLQALEVAIAQILGI